MTFHLAGGNAVSISSIATGGPGASISGGVYVAPAANGTITITAGNINNGQAINVTLATTDTVTGVADKINAAIKAADPTNGGHVCGRCFDR